MPADGKMQPPFSGKRGIFVNVPSDLKYTKSHEWVKLEGDNATIGITDYAQSELGDIVFVEMPNVGQTLQKEQTFGSVESVKTVSDIYAPVSGEIIETNQALGAQSELLNSDPYGKGWLIKVRLNDPADANALMDAEAYKGIVEH
jgi:glycine cleavage system H protein